MSDEKYAAEKQFWTEEKARYVEWYNGGMREFYGIPRPDRSQKVTRHADPFLNALDTWVNADRWRYCWHLFVEPTYFAGQRVLEIGPGPLGLARWFFGALVVGADPLVPFYIEAGYPLRTHGIMYCDFPAENLSAFDDGYFDAAISVNAIDHVDDFEKAVAELERVVKPDGEIRIETHYHQPTTTEPVVLTDQRVRNAFQRFPMKKLNIAPSSFFYPRGTHPDGDEFVLWSNKDYLYQARDALT